MTHRSRPDSEIWMDPAPEEDPLRDLVIPRNLDEIAQAAREESAVQLRDRVRRFRGRVSWLTLCRPMHRDPDPAARLFACMDGAPQ